MAGRSNAADRLFLLVGDVAGKGLSASLFMAVGKALYKSITMRGGQAAISELMQSANEEVSRDNPEMFFITAFAGILDLGSGALDYCNAGHDGLGVYLVGKLAYGARYEYEDGRNRLWLVMPR